MSNRINSITVVLKEDISEEWADKMVEALKLYDNVLSVTSNVSDPGEYVYQMRIRSELRSKLYQLISEL